MMESRNSPDRVSLRRAAVVSRLVLAAAVMPFTPAIAASALTLQVETSDTLPGFHIGDMPRYLALHMAKVGLADWRFVPSADKGSAPEGVEWRFKLNPYAGGEVRTFVRPHMADRIFAAYRPVTIEVRLYLHGEYQTLVEKQAIIEGGPKDPDLAAAVASITQSLLGPSGAYSAAEAAQRPATGKR
jgi:hypothetical protein